jgi:hypothetical protein
MVVINRIISTVNPVHKDNTNCHLYTMQTSKSPSGLFSFPFFDFFGERLNPFSHPIIKIVERKLSRKMSVVRSIFGSEKAHNKRRIDHVKDCGN